MRKSGGVAALAGAIIALCAVVAWAWYAHRPAAGPPQTVQQIAGSSPAPSAVPSPRPPAAAPPARTPSPGPASTPPGPVVYLPQAAPATPLPAPSATPFTPTGQPATSATEPMVAATLAPHVTDVRPISEPPDAPPRILAMRMSTPIAHSGELVSGIVETSSNVASVEARIAGYSSSMRKIGVGRFTLSYRVPNLPFFLHRTYTIDVIARNTRGDAVRTSVPITIR